jgi:hypothetical protein
VAGLIVVAGKDAPPREKGRLRKTMRDPTNVVPRRSTNSPDVEIAAKTFRR